MIPHLHAATDSRCTSLSTFHCTASATGRTGCCLLLYTCKDCAGEDIIELFQRIKSAVSGNDGPDLLDEPTLRRQIVEGILALRQRGPRGIDRLPPVVEVRVTVAAARSLSVVRGYVDAPAFDQEVGAALANRLVGPGATVPMRLFAVSQGQADEPSAVLVREAEGGVWALLRIEGGDRDGAQVLIAGDRPRYYLGRGAWHGSREAPANDIIVSHADRFVSRRAAVLQRAGSGLEITSRDQGEMLAVVRADGQRQRPTHARSGRLRLGAGDRIELNDGGRQRITLYLERPSTAPAPAAQSQQKP